MSSPIAYRRATRDELGLAVEWAAGEGWNPGLHDADHFWETDPNGFVCAEREGEVMATGSLVSYGPFGFMGFFIVRPDLRGQGIGRDFWHWRKQRLLGRLHRDRVIGMDGVFDMQPFYAKGGFVFSHRNLRMEGTGRTCQPDPFIHPLADVPFEEVLEMDRRLFGVDRERFLRGWTQPRDGQALAWWNRDRLEGLGVIRRCRSGFKIGPLYAKTPEVAEALFSALSHQADGEPLFLDVPEPNGSALDLAARHGMKEVFGCARMYHGPAPTLPLDETYGITTFELG